VDEEQGGHSLTGSHCNEHTSTVKKYVFVHMSQMYKFQARMLQM